ncbi:hypothetical protein [Hungatella hathewayi]|uniref:hypothetical protein n=1 Tax=Hungatella hathewayi TaxID=154046 RepID=UPI0035642F10
MDKEWVIKKNKEDKQKYEKLKRDLYQKLKTSIYLDEKEKEETLQFCDDDNFLGIELTTKSLYFVFEGNETECKRWYESLNLNILKKYCENAYDRYLDSEPMEFNGDIIITDPCYICKDKEKVSTYPDRSDFIMYDSEAEYPDYREMTQDEIKRLDPLSRRQIERDPEKGYISKQYQEENNEYEKVIEKYYQNNRSDWKLCNCGYDMEKLGITQYMTRDTLYGDWSCTTYDLNTKDVIGEFCADAGRVSVIALTDVLKYNPGFDYHKKKAWTTTWIKNFKGTVQFVVTYEAGVDKEGCNWEDYSVEVVGHGINKITGNVIDFVGRQTGM